MTPVWIHVSADDSGNPWSRGTRQGLQSRRVSFGTAAFILEESLHPSVSSSSTDRAIVQSVRIANIVSALVFALFLGCVFAGIKRASIFGIAGSAIISVNSLIFIVYLLLRGGDIVLLFTTSLFYIGSSANINVLAPTVWAYFSLVFGVAVLLLVTTFRKKIDYQQVNTVWAI